MDPPALPELPDHFRYFADSAARDGATTYADICRGVAEDPGLLALMDEAPASQRRPNLLLAAVHFLLLGGVAHELAAYYDTVASYRAEPFSPPEGDVVVPFRSFCLEHRAALLALLAVRHTQTNEVGRCAALLPALCAITAPYGPAQPVDLLDLGTSAGLNLLLDHYSYRYVQRDDGQVLVAGEAGSGVVLECVVRGGPSALSGLPSLGLPAIGARTGLDSSPIDPTTEDGRRWLLACQWPDHLPRFNRLRAALAVAGETAEPERPVLRQGDVIDDLVEVTDSIPAGNPLVVFHSWMAAYLTPHQQAQLVEGVEELARNRPVHYLYAESPVDTPGLPTPPSPEPRPTSHLATAVVHLPPDGSAPVRLADMHPHGNWIRWWATPTVPTGHRDGPGSAPLHR